jgi:uncharacterized protein (TIGR03083 family)
MSLETSFDARHITNLLEDQYLQLQAHLHTLSPEDWCAQSFCTEWKVYQVVAHLGAGAEIATRIIEYALRGGLELGDAERKAIWARFDSSPPERVWAEYTGAHQLLFAALDSLTDLQLAGQVPWFTGGTVPLARFLAARLNEQTLHRWDIEVVRDPDATLFGPALPDLLEFNSSLVAMLSSPNQAGALKGQAVEFELREPRAQVVVPIGEGADTSRPALHVATTTETFIRLIWGRYRAPAAPARLQLDHPELKDDLPRAFPGR